MVCDCCFDQNKPEEKKNRVCCVCHPYNDTYLMTAQILSIIAGCMSWVWWASFVLAFPIVITLQVAWCCKMKKPGFVAAGVLSAISSVCCIFAGIWIILTWKYPNKYCHVFAIFQKDYDYYWNDDLAAPPPDYCTEVAWAVVSFVDAALFAACAFYVYLFVAHRFDKLVAAAEADKEEAENPVHGVEMAVAVPHDEQTTPDVAPEVCSYAPPEVEAGKV